MQLIMSPPSPYVRKVRVLIREAGILDRVEEVEIVTSPMDSSAEAISGNPLGKIPSLLRPDGPSIYDSRVICRYLDDISGAGLYPQTRLYEVLTLEATADGIMDAAVGMIYEMRFREDKAWPVWLDKQWLKVDRALSAIESRWMSHLTGPLTMAQVAVGSALGYLDFRHPDRGWRVQHTTLSDWQDRFAERQSMKETHPG